MDNSFYALLAFLPIFLAGLLLVGFRIAAKIAMPLIFLVTCLIAFFFWGVSSSRIFASSIQGLIITVSILWIIFGAILLFQSYSIWFSNI